MNSFWNETGLVQVIWKGQAVFFTKLIFKQHRDTQRTGSYTRVTSLSLSKHLWNRDFFFFKQTKKINQGA